MRLNSAKLIDTKSARYELGSPIATCEFILGTICTLLHNVAPITTTSHTIDNCTIGNLENARGQLNRVGVAIGVDKIGLSSLSVHVGEECLVDFLRRVLDFRKGDAGGLKFAHTLVIGTKPAEGVYPRGSDAGAEVATVVFVILTLQESAPHRIKFGIKPSAFGLRGDHFVGGRVNELSIFHLNLAGEHNSAKKDSDTNIRIRYACNNIYIMAIVDSHKAL